MVSNLDASQQTNTQDDPGERQMTRNDTMVGAIPRSDNRRRKPEKGAIESISCSFLKMMCLSKDLHATERALAQQQQSRSKSKPTTSEETSAARPGNQASSTGVDDSTAEAGGAAFLKVPRAESSSAHVTNTNNSRRASMTSGRTLSSWSKNFVYLDKIVKEWTTDLEVIAKDPLVLGKSLEQINAFFAIKAEELPQDTILNSFTGRISNLTQMCIRFAEEIVQNILSRADLIPQAVKQFLVMVIRNSKEGDQDVLSLADSLVIFGFFI